MLSHGLSTRVKLGSATVSVNLLGRLGQSASSMRLRRRSGCGASVHLSFEQNKSIDVAFDRTGVPRQFCAVLEILLDRSIGDLETVVLRSERDANPGFCVVLANDGMTGKNVIQAGEALLTVDDEALGYGLVLGVNADSAGAPTSAPVARNSRYPTGKPQNIDSRRSLTSPRTVASTSSGSSGPKSASTRRSPPPVRRSARRSAPPTPSMVMPSPRPANAPQP
jgi:hypothetical protein